MRGKDMAADSFDTTSKTFIGEVKNAFNEMLGDFVNKADAVGQELRQQLASQANTIQEVTASSTNFSNRI